MVDRAGRAKDRDPQPEPADSITEKSRDEHVRDSVEKEPVKAAAEVAARDTELDRTRSTATDGSAITQATTTPSQTTPPRKWYQRLNPLRWGSVPPIPAERNPSPEHTAGFLSLLTFSWMGGLMTVSPSPAAPCLRSGAA